LFWQKRRKFGQLFGTQWHKLGDFLVRESGRTATARSSRQTSDPTFKIESKERKDKVWTLQISKFILELNRRDQIGF